MHTYIVHTCSKSLTMTGAYGLKNSKASMSRVATCATNARHLLGASCRSDVDYLIPRHICKLTGWPLSGCYLLNYYSEAKFLFFFWSWPPIFGTLLLHFYFRVTVTHGPIVYVSTALLSTFTILPLVPFTPHLHPKLTLYALIAFILSAAYNFTTFPFTSNAPIKAFLQQRVQVLPDGDVKAITALTGVPFHLQSWFMSSL
ncbi:hypothetical protein BDQ17DRAFT_367040 [Cyathus striatus]|nr:hypothetical protein BDQ17DRAFT_367040 [Cyathus striatus]